MLQCSWNCNWGMVFQSCGSQTFSATLLIGPNSKAFQYFRLVNPMDRGVFRFLPTHVKTLPRQNSASYVFLSCPPKMPRTIATILESWMVLMETTEDFRIKNCFIQDGDSMTSFNSKLNNPGTLFPPDLLYGIINVLYCSSHFELSFL